MSTERIVLHLDMDSFFASCEEKARPEIRGKPVVVCVYSGRGEEGGAVSTANYEARKFGVHSGMPIIMAKKMCPQGVFLPVDFDLYTKVSEEIIAILRGHAPVVEQVSVDEAFLELTFKAENFDDARKEAQAIKGEIIERTGLTCSVGIGPNKLIAKMAAGAQKPDGVTIVKPDGVKAFLSPLEPRKLWGVGGKTAEKLAEMKILTVGELAAQEEARLKKTFGEARGGWLKLAAQGIDNEPVEERGESGQVGRMMTLPRDTQDKIFVLDALSPLIEDVHERLVERGDYFRTITMTVVTTELKTLTRSRTLETPTRDFEVMKEQVHDLLSSFLKEKKGVMIRRAGVRVANLTKMGGQKTLLEF